MNVRQILNRVCAQMDEDRLEDDQRELALCYLNEAYDEMMRIYKPYVEVSAEVPRGGVTPFSAFGPEAGRVAKVRQGGAELPFDVTEEGIVAGAEGDLLIFCCRCLPAPIENDGDEPRLPAAYHGALADYATWRLMGTGGRARQQRGEMFFARYLQRKVSLAPESAQWRDSIVHKYG